MLITHMCLMWKNCLTIPNIIYHMDVVDIVYYTLHVGVQYFENGVQQTEKDALALFFRSTFSAN